MQNKCNQYEAYYVFCDEEKFNEHLKSCPDCQEEHFKMQKISSLVQGTKSLYFANNRKRLNKMVSCAVFLILSFTTIVSYGLYSNNQNAIMSDGSLLYDIGCPVDEYGLLQI